MITISKSLRQLADLTGALQEMIGFAEQFNSVEQALVEASRRLDEAKAERAAVIGEAQCRQVQAEEGLEQALAEAAEIVAEARKQAQQAATLEEEQREAARRAFAEEERGRRNDLAEIASAVEHADDTLKAKRSEIAAADQELAKARAKLDAIKAQVADLVKG